MSIWEMSGAELSREIDQPAPVTVLRGGHNGGVAGIVAQIAQLPPKERDALLAAFQAALKPEPKRLGSNTFKDSDQFFAAFNVARDAARTLHGEHWYLNPSASLKARVPPAWVALKGEMGTWRSPRDVNCPRAEFWPGGVLPSGPDYAEHGPLAPEGDIRTVHERSDAKRAKSMHAQFPTMAEHVYGFALEPTPEEIDVREAA